MQELIQITNNSQGESVVSTRELYEFLEVRTRFNDWCNRMFEYGFEEGRDFISFLSKSSGGRPETDYILTLDTAKEISMLQRTEKGKQIRNYFIAAEKALRSQTPKQALLPPRSLTMQLAEWRQNPPEIDRRTPVLSLHRFYRKPEPGEDFDCLGLDEIRTLTIAFDGGKVPVGLLKKELAKMGITMDWTTINGKQHLGYKVIILPFA